MSFWQTSDGKTAQSNEGKFEMGGGDIAPIADGTSVLAIAEEAKNNEYQGKQFINVKWRISKPAEYANRVIFQKIQVYEADQAKSDKAKRMLAAIASNAGGGLFSAMEQRKETMPSDMSLAQLCNRPMVLKLGVWELDDKSKSGNWVQAVSPAKATAEAAKPEPLAQPSSSAVDESDIPF